MLVVEIGRSEDQTYILVRKTIKWSLSGKKGATQQGVSQVGLRPAEVDPYFKTNKFTLGGVTKN